MSTSPSRSTSSPFFSFTSPWADLLWLVPVLGFFFFALLGARPLSNPDEGRYAEIPREMAATNDYVTPRLNGVKYFEKPPLVYWLTALSFEAGGVNETTARLPVAALAVFGAAVTYLGGRHLYGRATGLAAVAVLSTTLLYYVLSRVVILDLPVAVFISSALFSFIAALDHPDGARRRLLWYGFYASMALATLAKGLIGIVLPGGVAFVWVLLLNQWHRLRPFYPWTGSLLLLAIAAPWHVLASQRNHDFAQFYFIHEHFQRFFSTVHDRYQPFWYFGPVLLAGLFPWTFYLWSGVRDALRGGWANRRENAYGWFLVIWTAVIFLFFSKSQSKLIPYILPVFPALAVLIGRRVAAYWRGEDEGFGKAMGMLVALAYLGLAVALIAAPVSKATPEMITALIPYRLGLAAILMLGAGTIWHGLRRKGPRWVLAGTVIGMGAFLMQANPLGRILDTRSGKPLADALQGRIQESDTLYCVTDYVQDLPVYLNRRVSVVDYVGELEFGVKAEPEASRDRFIGREEFLRRWSSEARAYAVFRKSWFGDWETALPANRRKVIAETSRFLLLSNEGS